MSQFKLFQTAVLIIFYSQLFGQSHGSYQGGMVDVKLNYYGKIKIVGQDTIKILENDTVFFGKKYRIKQNLPDNYYYVFDIPQNLRKGKYRFYYDSLQNRLALKFSVKETKYDGLFEYFSPTGHIQYTSFYLNGRKNGVDISYDPSGKVSAITQYKDGEKLGFHFSVFYNSTTADVSYFTNDSSMTIIEKWGLQGETPNLLEKNTIEINKRHDKKRSDK